MNETKQAGHGAVAGPAKKCRDMAAQAGHYGAWGGGVLLEQAADEIERLRDLLAEASSCISCYISGVTIDDFLRPDAHELWRRCMVALGHDEAYINSLKRPNVRANGLAPARSNE